VSIRFQEDGKWTRFHFPSAMASIHLGLDGLRQLKRDAENIRKTAHGLQRDTPDLAAKIKSMCAPATPSLADWTGASEERQLQMLCSMCDRLLLCMTSGNVHHEFVLAAVAYVGSSVLLGMHFLTEQQLKKLARLALSWVLVVMVELGAF
jgi:hypothetical protein